MRLKFSDVSAEVRGLLNSVSRRKKVDLGKLTSQLMDEHQDFKGADADFHLCCSYRAVRHEIREQLNRRKRSEPKQFGFEFQFLQSSYALQRDGKEEHVPVEEATDAELLAKADEYDSMSSSLREHANEIRRYVALRASQPESHALVLRRPPGQASGHDMPL